MGGAGGGGSRAPSRAGSRAGSRVGSRAGSRAASRSASPAARGGMAKPPMPVLFSERRIEAGVSVSSGMREDGDENGAAGDGDGDSDKAQGGNLDELGSLGSDESCVDENESRGSSADDGQECRDGLGNLDFGLDGSLHSAARDVGVGGATDFGYSHDRPSASSLASGYDSSGDLQGVNGGQQRVLIAGFTPAVTPLDRLELTPNDAFALLLESDPDNGSVWAEMSEAEQEAVLALREQRAVVKTVKNADWTAFLKRFKESVINPRQRVGVHVDKPGACEPGYEEHKEEATEGEKPRFPFNSFVTSTTLLPSYGRKMRCFGSTKEYTVGVVFALPKSFPLDGDSEEDAVRRTRTWSWPAGYSAKTEFNIDARGNLINGREEALVPLAGLRRLNHSYLHDEDYEVGGRIIKGGLNTVPYNEVYMRVGGPGRIVGGVDCATGAQCDEASDSFGTGRSLDCGVGLPVALFVRSPQYGNLVSLLRTRARLSNVLGKEHTRGIPLLYVTPDDGTRVLTERLQRDLLRAMSRSLNPFQNPSIQHRTTIDNTSESHMQQKLEELIDLDEDHIRSILTPEECARIAGGFGATDDSVASLLQDVLKSDREEDERAAEARRLLGIPEEELAEAETSHKLQDIVNDGLTAAVRSGDYNTSRQLLILYTLVASRGEQQKQKEEEEAATAAAKAHEDIYLEGGSKAGAAVGGGLPRRSSSGVLHEEKVNENGTSAENAGVESPPVGPTPLHTPPEPSFMHHAANTATAEGGIGKGAKTSTELSAHFNPPPPPPPLDTDRLRSATNSDGLLAVLGAAQVLRAMQDEGAKRRVEEAVLAIEEWVENGEQSVAFRLASWRDQRAAQGDLKIATEQDSNFMAFISNKAISNRKKFAKQLRDSISATDFEDISFLQSIHAIVSKMHSPCLRLELLQYILGLDNRYSVAHVARSVELAATCMNISAYESMPPEEKDAANSLQS